jgi:endo-1,4-beta-xylanase
MFNNRLITRRRALYLGLLTPGVIGLVAWLKTRKSLKSQAAARGLIYGAAAGYSNLSQDTQFAKRFIQECSILVPENDLKWGTLRPTQDQFDFTQGDWLAKFAQQHGLLFRGHTLVWHPWLPNWLLETGNRQNAESLLVNHIETVVKHYQGQIHSWDVVNEAILPTDGRSNGLRNTPWLEWLGEDYIDLAFQVAAAADPEALLVYNDYDLDYDTPKQQTKRDAVLKLLERLKAKGTPIQALGIQAHLSANKTRFNPTKLRNFLKEVANMGLKILITEMDVADNGLPVDEQKRDRKIAEVYNEYLMTVLDEPAVIAILTWGLSDRYTWLSDHRPRKDGAAVRPLPLDLDLKPKLAWQAMIEAFDGISFS